MCIYLHIHDGIDNFPTYIYPQVFAMHAHTYTHTHTHTHPAIGQTMEHAITTPLVASSQTTKTCWLLSKRTLTRWAYLTDTFRLVYRSLHSLMHFIVVAYIVTRVKSCSMYCCFTVGLLVVLQRRW